MLKDKVIIITGAAGGIGSATARLFATHGAILILTDIHREGLEGLGALLKDSGAEKQLIEHDVADPESWQSLMEKVRQKYNRMGILCRIGIAFPCFFFFLFPLLEKTGRSTIKKRREVKKN